MPVIEHRCLEGHARDAFLHVAADLGAATVVCEHDGHTMSPAVSFGRGLTWMEESRPMVLHHLGHEPVTVRSHREYDAALRRAGVQWATLGRGRKGSWV